MKALPSDTLANGAEGIKDLITNFDEAYVKKAIHIADTHLPHPVAASRISRTSICHRTCTMQTLRKAEQ